MDVHDGISIIATYNERLQRLWPRIQKRTLIVPFDLVRLGMSFPWPAESVLPSEVSHAIIADINMIYVLNDLCSASEDDERYGLVSPTGQQLAPDMTLRPLMTSMLIVRPYRETGTFMIRAFDPDDRFKVIRISEVKIEGAHNGQFAARTEPENIIPIDWRAFGIA